MEVGWSRESVEVQIGPRKLEIHNALLSSKPVASRPNLFGRSALSRDATEKTDQILTMYLAISHTP